MLSYLLHPSRQLLLSTVLLSLASVSYAQPVGEKARPELPSRLQYLSPLRTYKPYVDQPVESWREANDLVGRIGGWRSYAKEIQTGVPAKDTVTAPVPVADPHAGHHGASKP